MFKLSLLTLEKPIFEGDVVSCIAPGKSGYLEILTDHAPIMTLLQIGKLIIGFEDRKKTVYALSGGVLEVRNNHASLLADAVEEGTKIDVERAKSAKERALNIIHYQSLKYDISRAKEALRRAENRIRIYQECLPKRH